MRRGTSLTAVDTEGQPQESCQQEHQNEVLSFHGAGPMELPQHRSSLPPLQLRGSPRLGPGLSLSIPLAQSPLLERQRTERSPAEFFSVGSAFRVSASATSNTSPQPVSPTAFSLDPATSPATQESKQFGRWLSTELLNTASSPAAAAASEGKHEEGDGDGVAAASPAATVSLGCRAPVSPLHRQANLSWPTRSFLLPESAASPLFAGPPLPSSSSSSAWRTWRLALSAFCLLNACLAFLFAWMMNTGQTAFALVAVERRWKLSERADATRLAGVYYVVLGLVLLIDRASAFVTFVMRLVGHCLRDVFTMGRHSMRKCSAKVAAWPLCIPVLRRCTRRVDCEEQAGLLPLPWPDCAAEANTSQHNSGLRSFTSGVARDGQGPSTMDSVWKPPMPMKIRRRGT
jgi:hypothetical protein